ncbi:hypothetical protein THAOC_35608, partial [Thalassiosira oceanica]
MKFSSAIVAAVVASSSIIDVSAFGTSGFGVRRGSVARQPLQMAKAKYDLDLGDVDLSSPPPAPVAAEKPKKGKKAKKVEEPKPVVEEPKPAKKAKKVKAEAPPKVVEEKPAPAKKSKKKVVEEPKVLDKV